MAGREMKKLIKAEKYIVDQWCNHNRTNTSLAEEFHVSLRTMCRFLNHRGMRKSGDVSKMLERDKELVIALYNDGMGTHVMGEKFECSPGAVLKKLKEWGVDVRKPISSDGPPPKISMTELRDNWVDINEKMTVTISGVPRFHVTPIGNDDE